ncbi:DNA alkylation response protein [Rhodovulum sp. 12E13]|uniref:acyl-CoA dehydrogenase family protein n=1 Tax=Rhodovulum sp. 12E13 TaxID=2203891 RepID=UPI000E1598B6|nr:acyl-CoA dehydrogenase family protein [Rhodovulum sp. 12E13]RDC74440.1 DNA alkylation response protein [Rhodovulum sp. 12E13]
MHGISPPPAAEFATHEVTNQPEMGGDRDVLASDRALAALAPAFGADMAALRPLADELGREATREAARAAQRQKPELVTFDRAGRRLDEVRFHPAYHDLMRLGLEAGYAAGPWTGGRHATHAAMVYLFSQVEPGVCCPMTMTYAALPALVAAPELDALWRPRLTAAAYDPAIAPVATKRAATLGMAMTEKQGGSDVRANSTRAEREGHAYRLTGHKWFCSAPMSDGFLTLAQASGGLTCFLVPRWLAEGRNAIHLMRLKDKLGNTANASAEIEYHGALAHRLGAEGDGVRTIVRMVHHTRLDTAMAPAGLMRAALDEALRWCAGRTAFQKRLIDQPLMRAVLADLALDTVGALALGLRVARAFDAGEAPFARVAVALAKYLSNKRCPTVVAEAMEALGGMGYVEDTPLPMLYREAPLNGIWEGSGNVICLDALRTLAREPEAAEALAVELDAARGLNAAYDTALCASRDRWPSLPDEAEARAFAERTGALLTAAVLLRSGPPAVAEGYAATRLGQGGRGLTPGTARLGAGPILGAMGWG